MTQLRKWRTLNNNVVCLRDLNEEFKSWCKEEKVFGIKKSTFVDAIKGQFEKGSWKDDTTIGTIRVKNCWRGYKLKSEGALMIVGNDELDK